MTVIKQLIDKDEGGWQGFIQLSEKSTIYHTLEWKRVIEETYGYNPYYFVAEENNKIQGILPMFQVKSFITGNRLVSLPFSYLGGPIATSDDVMSGLINAAIEKSVGLRCKYLELKAGWDFPDKVISGIGLLENRYYISSVLELTTDSKDVWSKLHKNSVQRSVRKAEKYNVDVRSAYSLEDIKSFYNLNLRTRRKHGVPTQPLRFFEKILEHMHSNFMDLLLATYKNKTIAAIILFKFRNTLLYAYGASDDRYLNIRPNNLLLWKAIEYGCNNDFHYFDFGKTARDENNLLEFKKRWGAENYELPYYYYPKVVNTASSNRSSLKYRLMTSFWAKMPLPVSRTLSPILMRHLG